MKQVLGLIVGEVGWQVSAIIPYYRWLASRCDDVVMVGPEWAEYLCSDFCKNYIVWQPKSKNGGDRWNPDCRPTVKPFLPGCISGLFPQGSVKLPNEKRCMSKKKKAYLMYGESTVGFAGYNILIHARATKKYGQTERNYSLEKYRQITEAFPEASIASIGSPDGSALVHMTQDLRGCPTELLCQYMRAADVVLGSSSGPMHLASHCGSPHVVITGNERQKALGSKTNRYRYEKLWNPFGTSCTVLDKHAWNPPVADVVRAVEEYL